MSEKQSWGYDSTAVCEDCKEKHENDIFDDYCDCGQIYYDNYSEAINELVEDIDGFILTGSSGTWQGRRTLKEQFLANWDAFMEGLCPFDSINVSVFLKKDESLDYIDYTGHHHDGSNNYTMTPFDNATKSDIIDMLNSFTCEDCDEEHTREEQKEISDEILGKRWIYSRLTKDELKEIANEIA